MQRGYVTTKDAAAYLGVCTKTFKRMLNALPARQRPRPVQFPGVTSKRWRIDDLDSAFSRASATAGWDRLVEEKPHVTEKRRSVG